MRSKVGEKILAEWKQMSFLHKLRFTVCINLMVVFSWGFVYYLVSRIMFNLISFHYATTVLYADDLEMKASMAAFYDMTFYASVAFDLIVYILGMVGLVVLSSRKQIFTKEDDVMFCEVKVKRAWKGFFRPKHPVEQDHAEELVSAIVEGDDADVKSRVDNILKERKK